MPNDNTITLEISAASIMRALALTAGALLLYALKEIFAIVLFAIIIASGISPFASSMEKRGIPRIFAVLLLYVIVFGLLLFLASLVIPFLSQDLAQLTSAFPRILEGVTSSLDTVQNGSPRYFDFVSELQNILAIFSSYLQQFSQSSISFVISIFGGLFAFVATIVISFYFSIMKDGIDAFIRSVTPTKYENYLIDLWHRAEVKVGRWLQGQMLLALIVGLLVYVGLELFNVKFALLLGILAMALEIVPFAGPILAAIPAIGLAFLQDPMLGVWVFVFYGLVQQIESHVLAPLVLGKTTGMNPVVVILALLIGAKLYGIAGALLGVPVATVVVEVIDDLARRKELRRQQSA